MNCVLLKGIRTYLSEPFVHKFICESVGVRIHMDQASSIGFTDKHGVFTGGFLFEQYTGKGGSVHSHFAGAAPGWLTRRVLNLTATYVFGQLGCERVYGRVNSKDEKTMEIDERIGFRKIATLEGYFPDADLIVYEMKRDECRWLPKAVGEQGG